MSDKLKTYVYEPRITFQTSERIFNKIEDLIPWGVRKKIWNLIANDLIRILENEQDREAILGAILSGKFKLEDFSTIGKIVRGSDG